MTLLLGGSSIETASSWESVGWGTGWVVVSKRGDESCPSVGFLEFSVPEPTEASLSILSRVYSGPRAELGP